MSWEEAQREAQRWLDACGVPHGNIKGRHFDLHDKLELIPPPLGFRAMVVRAARRIIEKRGAKAWLPDVPDAIRE
jgi:hypothetical protein